MKSQRIMTTKELADYIKLNEKTVLKMAQEGKLPGVKIGSQWRFHIDSIDAYFQNDIIKSKDEELELIINSGVENIPISRLVSEDLISLELKAKNSQEVLLELAEIAYASGLTKAVKGLVFELEKREKMLSTAIGDGVAIPHPRHPSDTFFKKPNIIFARSPKGIAFSAPDKKPVILFFMTCAQNEFVHLRLLAKISRLLHEVNIKKAFFQAKTKEEIIQLFLKKERKDFLQK